jgi:hypothetical protein
MFLRGNNVRNLTIGGSGKVKIALKVARQSLSIVKVWYAKLCERAGFGIGMIS